MSIANADNGGLARWASVADAVAATASKREKVNLVATYLAELDAGTAELAARFFSGRVFATGDAGTLGIGGAALSRVLRSLGDIDDVTLSALWARSADAGATVRDLVLEHAGAPPGEGISLQDVAGTLGAIATASKPREREDTLLELLRKCSAAEAAAVARMISGELRIGLREGLVEEAIGIAFGVSAAAIQRANMLTGDLGEVARLAAMQRIDDAAPRLFVPLRFMLAGVAADAAEAVARMGTEIWVEDKYDGIRCQVHAADRRVALYSRDLKDITEQFPDIAKGEWPDGAILDGEILAFRDGRVLPFFALQRRLGRKRPTQAFMDEVPVVYVAWDVLHSSGETSLELPLRARRQLLEALALPEQVVLSHRVQVDGADALDAQFLEARARLNEGLMVKNPESFYLPGRRGYHWMKLKRPLDTLDVVVIGAEYGHGKRHGVLSDVTFAVRDEDKDELVPIGKAYTGLTDAEIAEMTILLHELSIAEHGRYRTVTPQVVLEIAFDSVQESKRHRSGYALRFPRIVRWRHDKAVGDVDTLERVRKIAETRAAEFTQRVDPVREGG